MNQVYNRSITPLPAGKGAVEFGFSDQKGRSVGYRWQVSRVVYTPKEGIGGYVLPKGLPLEHLIIEACPTRDGKRYGAWTGYLHCLSLSEAEVLITKRTEAARKRDAKKFGEVT